MAPSFAAQLGAILAVVAAFLVFTLTHLEIFKRSKSNLAWGSAGLVVSLAITLGSRFLPLEFRAELVPASGGLAVALLILWQLEIKDLKNQNAEFRDKVERAAAINRGLAVKAAFVALDSKKDPDKVLEGMVKDGAITQEVADSIKVLLT